MSRFLPASLEVYAYSRVFLLSLQDRGTCSLKPQESCCEFLHPSQGPCQTPPGISRLSRRLSSLLSTAYSAPSLPRAQNPWRQGPSRTDL